jgi:preprotein translocase subunit SecA
MIESFNKLLKSLFGSKIEKDLKEITPIIEDINAIYATLSGLSNDELRAKSNELRQRIAARIAPAESRIAELKLQAEAANPSDLQLKETIYEEIDQLTKQSDKDLEEVLAELLPEAFAVVKETARRLKENKELEVTATDHDREMATRKNNVRIEGDKAYWANSWNAAGNPVTWDMVHYDVQLIGGIALHRGKVAEMTTGEGKTLVATLPVFLNALAGRGVHLVTVNDYLAKRDSEWNAPLFEFHGMVVDCIDKHQPNSDERRKAYRADITYGTNNEFGFDYLRDNMAVRPEHLVQRKHHFAIVDEVDSVLIDEARTPLIISGPTPRGDQQDFDLYKPKVQQLYNAQRALVTELLAEAKKRLTNLNNGASKEDLNEGGMALLRAYRGLPKTKALIKFLSEEGVKQHLLKTEAYYLQNNQQEMWKIDQELYFVIDEKNNQVELAEKGLELISKNVENESFFIIPDVGSEMATIENSGASAEEKLSKKQELLRDYSEKSQRIHTINQLLKAYALFELDVDYVIMENKVKIVDEQTGRIMEGRRYSDGLHQAIEAKENVKVEAATQTYATVTLQNYFRMYHKLAGMTGTAETEAQELWDIYKLDVMIIPTNRPIQRKDIEDLVYRTKREKYQAVIEEIVKLRDSGRPVLVGTTTVEVSELLSKMLKMRNIDHQVLNAKMHQREAEVVALAGLAGTVTIATNMAGRGTDIKLGPGVKEAGGLAIVGTERHDSRRVDRQLRGRSGRQGDPGSSQFFVSLEDDLMRLFVSDRTAKIMDRLGLKEGEVIQHSMITRSIERAQKKVEENNFGIRKRLLEYDDVMNAQREVIYKRRRHALFGERVKLDIANMFYDLVENAVLSYHPDKNYEGFELAVIGTFGIAPPFSADEFMTSKPDELVAKLYDASVANYAKKGEHMGQMAWPVIKNVFEDTANNYENIVIPFSDGKKNLQIVGNLKELYESQCSKLQDYVEKNVTLALIDNEWKEHLRNMDDLRKNVQFATHEQKDPLLIYKFESYELFKKMIHKINSEVASFLIKCTIPQEQRPVQAAVPGRVQQAPQNVQTQKAGVQNLNEQMETQRQVASGNYGGQRPPVTQPVKVDPKVGRNDPCPCGSGKKYKQCHGA